MTSAAVCLIVKNEARYMVEWIAHYLAMGFDEIMVYDNGSTDATLAVAESFGRRFDAVNAYTWPDVPGQAPQLTAYADALSRSHCEWLAFFDADELLVLKQHACVQDFLARYPDDAGAVVINWLLFGSSGETDFVDELQAVRFRMCACDGPETKNRFVKSIARIRASQSASPHTVALKPGYSYYNDVGLPAELLGNAKTSVVSHAVAQVNHYIVRSVREFQEKRLRGNATRSGDAADKFSHRDEKFWRTHNTNHIEDSAVDVWVDRAVEIRHQLQRGLADDDILIR